MLDIKFSYDHNQSVVDTSQFDTKATKEELSLNMACYLQMDGDYIKDIIDYKYNSGGKILPIYSRFFTSFIDSKSNLYKNYFERIVNGDYKMVSVDELNFSLEQAEKIMHISGQSIMYVKAIDEFTVFDPSKYNKINDNHYEIFTDDGKIHVKNDGIYSETRNENGDVELIQIQSLTVLPIVEFFDSKYPKFNTLCDLQYNWIADLSWGIFNSSPKLLSQFIIQTESEDDKIKAHAQNLGHQSKVIKMAVNDKVSVIEMGDLNNLKDIVTIYNDIIKQQAVSNGVDKNAINVLTLFESGVAKTVEMSYINDYRRKFFRIFKKGERKLWNIISILFGIKCEYVDLKFYPIKFTETSQENYIESVTMNETEYQIYKSNKEMITQSSTVDEKKS